MTESSNQIRITQGDVADGLRRLGVEPGMRLMVHSSLRSFGHIEGGPLSLIAALQRAVTPEGTIMMPSFNHDSLFMEGGPGIYDPMESPTINGAIPELFWRGSDVFRSLNPTHAFACWGEGCKALYREAPSNIDPGKRLAPGLALSRWGLWLANGRWL